MLVTSGWDAYCPQEVPQRENRWTKRVLNWHPASRRKVGKQFATWETYFEKLCRYNGLGTWYTVAADVDLWRSLMDDFVPFCSRS